MENPRENLANDFFKRIRHGDKKAFRRLKKLANEGNAQAMSNLAEVYLKGFGGVESSYEKAFELLNKAATLNNRSAFLKLGEIYAEGCGNIKPDAQKAIEYLNKADAEFELMEFYRDGKAGTKPDGYKVIEYLSKFGFRHMKTIAEIYRDGKYNVKADGYKAIEYFIGKAECEDMASKFNFIEKYKDEPILFGDPADTNAYDDVMEYSYFEEIAEIYLKRSVGDEEYNDAVEYCFEAREIGNVDVFQEIAKIYLEGKGGVRPDGYKALEYFLKASEGINLIIDFTKNFIEDNSEIKQERQGFLNRIFRWLGRINADIYEQIAEIYSVSKAGIQSDGHKAIEYLLKAIEAERDNPDEDSKKNISAIYNRIAWIYLEGCGSLEPNTQKALEFYRKAAALGNDSAKEELAMRHLS